MEQSKNLTTLPLKLRDLDRRIWAEELDPVLPQRIFDIHTHVYRREHVGVSSPVLQLSIFRDGYPNVRWRDLELADQSLLPGRTVHRLVFGFPFQEVDFQAINEFTIEESRSDSTSAALLLVQPTMTAEQVEQQVLHNGFVGFKPYRLYSHNDPAESRITDFLPEHQIAIADRYGLLIVLQLSKRRGVADPQNIDDLERLTQHYPNVKWILAHCARAFYPQPLERVGQRLKNLTNVFFDSAAVCEYATYDYLLQLVGPSRLLYASDDLPACIDRGKYITWGEAWTHFNEGQRQACIRLDHCNADMTFIRYEVLRALCRAIRRHQLKGDEISAIFHDTGARLVQDARLAVQGASDKRTCQSN